MPHRASSGRSVNNVKNGKQWQNYHVMVVAPEAGECRVRGTVVERKIQIPRWYVSSGGEGLGRIGR